VFEVDLASGIVHKENRRIDLQEQPFKILRILVERPGQLVTREELYRALWPTGTFVELDQGLNTAVKKLRIALGDSAENPQLIETIPRRGYRLIAPVEPVADAEPGKERRRRLGLLLACIVVGCAAFVVGLIASRGGTSNAEFTPTPLTSYPGLEFHPSFSPDGSQVVFRWFRQPGEVSDLYTKVVGASGEVRLTHGPSDSVCPTWSPDGRSIAFLRDAGESKADLLLISPLGGPERKLAEVELPPYGSCPAWHSNGKSLILSHRKAREDSFPLFSMSVDNGAEFQLTFPPKVAAVDRDPAVSPHGDAIVFARGPQTDPSVILLDLFLLPLSRTGVAKGEPIRITFDRRTNYAPAWTPDERAIVFSSGPAHSPSLYELDFSLFSWSPRKVERLAFAGDGVRGPTISANGRLAYAKSTIRANIWRLELNGPHSARKPAERLIASTHLDHTPEYSPDGTRIAFSSDRSGSHEIWVANSDGSGATQLTSFSDAYYRSDPRWSPEGAVVFSSNSGGTPATYSVSPEGGVPKRLGPDETGTWSHDHKQLYFDARNQIWRTQWPRSTSGAAPVQVTRGGGLSPRLSPDDRFVYYLKDDHEMTSVWKVPAGGGTEMEVIDSVCCHNFEVVDQGIYFIPGWHGEPHSTLKFFDFARRKTTLVADLPGLPAYGLSLSPEGKNILFSLYEPPNSDLWMVERFR
jgi:Tol biopolymer transport system component/DNA-binding winged helix-turn-helix (wHTH) protein